ncbi:MAG: AAA family ATPase, partial [Clostridiales bacterium]|nr:AAA family ATPase [Clostridiales bacterium]
MTGAFTLRDYAQQKGFNERFINMLGMGDDARGVTIPYFDENHQSVAVRCRHAPGAENRFTWKTGSAIIPYGVWIPGNRSNQQIILVEGESDAQSMWQMSLACLGIPGAASFKKEWVAKYIKNRPVWIHVENDAGGQTFVTRTSQLLREGGHTGPICRFSCADIDKRCKDLSDLYLTLGPKEGRTLIVKEMNKNLPTHVKPKPVASESLPVYRPSEICDTLLEKPVMVLDNTLSAGLCLLAGAPKKGKSWLAMDLALCVAQGTPCLNRATRQGTALYLDLESRQYRVKERLAALHEGTLPDDLYITHRAPRMDEGLVDALGEFVSQHPDTRLIIIDTLARVKSPGTGGENVYEADTRIMGRLQAFALDHGLCLLLIHHLRKSSGGFKETDVYERVSGSTGLTGVCDCVLILDGKRQESEAQLYVDGRDIPPVQLALDFDKGKWTLLSEDGEGYRDGTAYDASPLPRALKNLMDGKDKWEGRPADLAGLLEEASSGACSLNARDVYRSIEKILPELREREGITAKNVYMKGSR